MKHKLALLSCLTIAGTFLLQSCEKKIEKKESFEDTELVVHSGDQAMMSGEMDAITNEINVPLEATVTGREESGLVCSAIIAYDTAGSQKKVTITYNGDDCAKYRSRKGVVEMSIPAGVKWSDAGAEITVNYINLKVTRNSDKRYIIINGTHKITNVSGGISWHLALGKPSITHTITSNNMSVTFDDGTQRQWQVARQRVYTLQNGGTITVTGTHTQGNQTGIAEWGTDRFGKTFVTAITEPLVVKATCQYRLVSGQLKHDRTLSSA
ncbi:MAG: hypothetical protein EOP49_51760, partial [Sphingobacteriales bacterium]